MHTSNDKQLWLQTPITVNLLLPACDLVLNMRGSEGYPLLTVSTTLYRRPKMKLVSTTYISDELLELTIFSEGISFPQLMQLGKPVYSI
jgi:hypothetical protein